MKILPEIKLLLVDDEPDVLEFLKYNFKKKGFKVSHALDGVDAIEIVKANAPDIIICDILMPHMSGPDFCRALKEVPKFKNIPFVFLSASDDDVHILNAMYAGGEEFISKPIPFNVLLEIVNDVIMKIDK